MGKGKDRGGSDTPEYFRHFESDQLPNITWQEMVEQRKVIGPRLLTSLLRDAKKFLQTESGPNQQRRIEFADDWFNVWEYIIRDYSSIRSFNSSYVDSGDALVAFDDLHQQLVTQERTIFPNMSQVSFLWLEARVMKVIDLLLIIWHKESEK